MFFSTTSDTIGDLSLNLHLRKGAQVSNEIDFSFFQTEDTEFDYPRNK